MLPISSLLLTPGTPTRHTYDPKTDTNEVSTSRGLIATPWDTDRREMYKTSVFKRHSKWQPFSKKVRRAIEPDDALSGMIDAPYRKSSFYRCAFHRIFQLAQSRIPRTCLLLLISCHFSSAVVVAWPWWLTIAMRSCGIRVFRPPSFDPAALRL